MRETAKIAKSENHVLSVVHDHACWWHGLCVPFALGL